jgi:hypothetical protein
LKPRRKGRHCKEEVYGKNAKNNGRNGTVSLLDGINFGQETYFL